MATVRILRSTTAAAVPPSLVSGQIAINEADGKLFYRNGSGAVTQLATGGGGGGTELFTYANAASFPGTGVTTALYLSISSGRVYQWNGSVYSEVGPVGGGGSLSATVTIPATGDQYWDSVKLLMRGDGVNNGTTFSDSSAAAKSITRIGNVVTSTAQSKFGGASLYFDGSDSVLEVGSAYDADIAGFGTGDFTIELWFRTESTSRMSIVSAYKAAATASGFALQLNKDDGGGPIAGSVSFGYGDTVLVSTTGGKWSANTWHHVAIVRSGATLTIYVDGVSQASASNSTDIADGIKLSLGGLSIGSYIQDYTGYLDDVRITRAARYTSAFTPPTATYATGTYTAAQTLSVVGTGSVGPSEDAALRTLFIPAAPTSLTVTGGNAQAVLSWTAPSVSAQTPITDYREQFSSDNGATWSTFSAAASTATSATITGLTNGTAYVFRVAAVNALGTGAYTAASSAVTPAAAPAGVTVLSGSASGSGTNTITATATGNISVSVPSTRTLTWTGSPGQYIAGPQQAGFSYDSEYDLYYRNFIGSSFSVIAGTYTTENTQSGATLTFTP